MPCQTCGHEHPTQLETLACDEINRGAGAMLTTARRQQLRTHPDEAWTAAVEVARARRHPTNRRRIIYRAAAALVALVSLAACTPTEIAWWTSTVRTAENVGRRCPDLAPALQLSGLPAAGFDYIIWRESRCDPTVINTSSGALGLTQIMPQWLPTLCGLGIACSTDEMLDAHTNLAAAAYVFSIQGWQAWATTAP